MKRSWTFVIVRLYYCAVKSTFVETFNKDFLFIYIFFLKQMSTNNGRVHLCLWTQTIFRFLIWMFLLVYVSLYLFIFIYMLVRLCLFNILTNINKWTRKWKFVVYLFIFIWLNLNQQIWKNSCSCSFDLFTSIYMIHISIR